MARGNAQIQKGPVEKTALRNTLQRLIDILEICFNQSNAISKIRQLAAAFRERLGILVE